jgi:transcription elongation factor Elf1
MSPRKSRYATPEWVAQSIRNKRKKLLYGSYDCPKCGDNKLGIQVDKRRKEVVAACTCGLRNPLKYVESYERTDYYNTLIDQFYKKK